MMQTVDRRRLNSVAPPAGAWRQVSVLVIMACMSLLITASDGFAQYRGKRPQTPEEAADFEREQAKEIQRLRDYWEKQDRTNCVSYMEPVPKNFPFPFYPGSKALGAEARGQGSLGDKVCLVSSDSAKPIWKFYKKYFQSAGWRLSWHDELCLHAQRHGEECRSDAYYGSRNYNIDAFEQEVINNLPRGAGAVLDAETPDKVATVSIGHRRPEDPAMEIQLLWYPKGALIHPRED